ncbi:MAG: diguanylate cyclase (GGDEF)-like protein [Planctomycetota bacterium]|jgi:diguanylate cyclase (GGDEF)-like protein
MAVRPYSHQVPARRVRDAPEGWVLLKPATGYGRKRTSRVVRGPAGLMSTLSTTLSFNAVGRTLFSVEEVRHLMRVEFDRSKRYGYPVSCLMIGIDRIESLHSVHGTDCSDTILQSVLDLIRFVTRTSDYLGCLMDERILTIFPHTSQREVETLSERLLAGARSLTVAIDETPLRVTLSLGLAHNAVETNISFDTLLRVAEEGLAVADAGGGDRVVETELYQLYERSSVASSGPGSRRREDDRAGSARRQSDAPPGQGADVDRRLDELQDSGNSVEEAAVTLAEEIVTKALRRLEDERCDNEMEAAVEAERRQRLELEHNLEKREREISSKWQEEMAATRDRENQLEGREVKYQSEIDLLQRRIAKLTQSLGATEGELQRLAAVKSVDSGISSVFREVQGLSSDDSQLEAKQGLMSSIFKANLQLQLKRSA